MKMLKAFSAVYMIVFVCFSFVLAQKAFSGVVVESNNGEKVYHYEIDNIDFSPVSMNNSLYLKAKLYGLDKNLGILYKKGSPEVPVVRQVVYASSKDDIKLSFDRGNLRSGFLELSVIPSQESQSKSDKNKPRFAYDKKLYESDSFFPKGDYDIKAIGSYKGKKRFLVTVYPFKYNPKMESFNVRKSFSIKVSNSYKRENVINGLDTIAFIVGQKYGDSQDLERYINFKRSLGFNTVKYIVGSDVNNPLDIRLKLKELLSSDGINLKHAIIIGDIEDVPAKKAGHLSLSNGVTDHYYRAIDTDSYEEDINSPDIGVGRITVKNNKELSQVVEKLIRYQRGNFSDEKWLDMPSFIATDDRYVVAEGSHNFVIDNYMTDRGYYGVFPLENNPGGDKLYAITHKVSDKKVVDSIKEGRFLINYSGHGSTTYWAGPHVTQSDVRSLTNNEINPFVVSNACITGQFSINESFGETWIKHPAGAVMFWGSMDSSYWDEDDILERKMYSLIYDDKKVEFSNITQESLAHVWQYYGGENRSKYYWETYVTFGDPSIEFRNAPTKKLSLEGPSALPKGIKNVSYTVSDTDGNYVENLRVALVSDSKVYGAQYSNSEGRVVFDITDAKVGESIEVIAYGQNYKLSKKNLIIIRPDEPFLSVTKLLSNNKESKSVYAGEFVNISIDLKNFGLQNSTQATITLEKETSNIEVVGSKVSVKPITSGESSRNIKGLSFKVSDNVLNGDVAKLKLIIRTEEQIFEESISYFIVMGKIIFEGISFSNTGEFTSGGIGSGETGDFFITIKNDGAAPLENIRLNPVSVDSEGCINNVSGDIHINKLVPGQSIKIEQPITVSLNDKCKLEEIVSLNLLGLYDDFVIKDKEISFNAKLKVGKEVIISSEESGEGLEILDKKKVEVPFLLSGIRSLKNIRLHIDLKHSYIGDLVITLVHPSGDVGVIRSKTGGGTDDLHIVYGIGGEAPEDISPLTGKDISGEWKVVIEDKANSDQGSIEKIKLELIGIE